MTNYTTSLKKKAPFYSDLEIIEFMRQYCDEQKQMFVKFRTQSLNSVKLNYKSEINKDCTYYYIIYNCKYGIPKSVSCATLKESSTFKRNCKAFIKFRISSKTGAYIIEDFNETHCNHKGLEEFYDHLPEKRRLNSKEKIYAGNLLSLSCKPARLQLELKKKYKKEVRRKDLLNLAAIIKSKDKDNINGIIEILKSEYEATAKIFHEDKVLIALYFSTEKMRTNLQKFGQIIFVDGTYKIFKDNYILILFVVEDGEGRSQIVGVAILTNETKPVIEWLMETFKKDHKAATNTIKGFMTDKDLTERDVIKKIFPNTKMFICQFHVLKTFNREICPGKIPINMKERENCLKYIDNMVKSNSEEVYLLNYEEFLQNSPEPVIEYFNKNWHPIRKEWVKFNIFQSNYGNLTNNRIESMNSKLKDFLRKYNSIISFIKDFFAWDQHRRTEMSYSDIQKTLKKNVKSLSEDTLGKCKQNYASLLTNYAFKKVCDQLELHEYVTLHEGNGGSFKVHQNENSLNVSASYCTCLEHWSMSLPCRHILAVRKLLNMNLFCETLCDKRWIKKFNDVSQVPNPNENQPSITIHKMNTNKKSSIGSKRRLVKAVTDELISLAAEQTEHKFQNRLDFLRKLRDSWKKNVNMMVHKTKENEFVNSVNAKENLTSFETLNISDSSTGFNVEDLENSIAEIKIQESKKIIGRVSDALQTTLKKKKQRKKK